MSDTLAPGAATHWFLFPQRPRAASLGHATALVATCLLGLATLGAAPAAAAARTRAPAVTPPSVADFQALSGAYAATCAAPGDPALAALGQPSLRRCAWSQRIEMQYWPTLPDAGNACLAAPALSWQRLGAGMRATVAPWDSAWRAQGAFVQDASRHQAAALWRRPDGQWSAVLWRWQPSERSATRAWQQANWNKVTAAIEALGAGAKSSLNAPLDLAWLDASRGKPRLAEGASRRWIADGACLSMQDAGTGQARLHLPFSRDDVRQEQRSAMQVLLARRFPAAEWIRPFSLVEPHSPGARSGAKFLAVWKEGAVLHGQLWVTLRDEGGIVRARISSGVPAAPNSARAEDLLKARTALIERELTTLAHAWEGRHE